MPIANRLKPPPSTILFPASIHCEIEWAKTTLVPTAPYEERHRLADGKLAPMWVTIDLQKAPEAPAAAKAPKGKETRSNRTGRHT